MNTRQPSFLSSPSRPQSLAPCYLDGITPDEYLLRVSNVRGKNPQKMPSKRRMVMKAQRNPNDLALYLEGSVALPADLSTVNVLIYTVPSGTDVIITAVRNTWSGNGFQDGQGLLTWAYVIGGGFIMNRGQVGFQNTASNGWQLVGSGGALVYENQQIIIQATTSTGANAALTGGLIEAQIEGFFIMKD